MKYYRYAKCIAAGGMHPHASLLIGTSFPDTRVASCCTRCMTLATMLERHLPWIRPWSGTIQDLVKLAVVLIKAKPKQPIPHTYNCMVSKRQVQW